MLIEVCESLGGCGKLVFEHRIAPGVGHTGKVLDTFGVVEDLQSMGCRTMRPNSQALDMVCHPGSDERQWDQEPARYASQHPLPVRTVTTHDDLVELMGQVIDQFRRFVEEQRGWSLLWNDKGTEKPEEAVQLLFLGVAQPYLRQFNVELDREVELGRGPVDFKASSGSTARLLIEIRKLHNGKFWNGLRHQLLSYLKSDDATHGWFIAIQYRDNKPALDRLRGLPREVALASQRAGKSIRYGSVDARRPLSASKIDT